ncbi:MAG: TrmH family RNA methyltransferase [Firmicutes bacterium]|nr:TrmH family RNA methyltransferase [Bacillota bacterium]MDY3091893.1 TrmH family RNA methyltransferase [Erysipelotrichaceae bacterium]
MEHYDINGKYSYTLGMSISIELINNHPELVSKVYYSSRMNINENYDKLKKLCEKHHIELINDDHVIDSLSVKENCYVIAVFRKFINELRSPNHLVIYGHDDEGALGTILRTAVSFNHRDIILINNHTDYFNPKVVRASMGAVFYTNIKRYSSVDEYLNDYPSRHIYSISNEGDTELSDVTYEEPYSLVYGYDIGSKIYISHNNSKKISDPLLFAISLHHFYSESKRKR